MTATLPAATTTTAVAAALLGLAELPDADAIAAHLGTHGARGWRGEPDFCPVADYLWLITGHRTVLCQGLWFDADNPPAVRNGVLDHGVTPPRVGEFITRFDQGYYPELEALG